jgi:hypothetical protein
MKPCTFFIAGVFLLAPVACATQITFDELGTGSAISANNLHVAGVLFQFTGGSAQYNGAIGSSGTTGLVSDPLLVGNTTGTLTLAFDISTPILRFDIAMESVAVIPGAYTVSIPGIAPFVEETAPIVLFSEGEFLYTGSQPLSRAVITFSNAAPAFGLDNLTFEAAPEPASGLLLGGAFLALGVLIRRHCVSSVR